MTYAAVPLTAARALARVTALPPARACEGASWEPLLVTTLRLYWRRRASQALLLRLSGGPRAWRLLNEWWNIDGTAPPCPIAEEEAEEAPAPEFELGAPLALLAAERRIALVQISRELAEREIALPILTRLGRYFGVTRGQINHDLEALRNQGAVDWQLTSDGRNGVRRQPLPVEAGA